MSKKRMSFPMKVPEGSVTVKIYRVRNNAYQVTTKDKQVEKKERFSFMVSFFAEGGRREKMFASFDEAHTEAKSKATALSHGELDD